MVLPVGAPNMGKRISRSTSANRNKTSTAGVATQVVVAPPMFMQHVTPNVQTDVHIGLTPKGGGGFFASGLLRTRQRPRATSMLPLSASESQEDLGHEKAPLIAGKAPSKGGKPQVRQKYYPLSQEETLELLYLLNQGVRESLVQVDPLAAALAYKKRDERKQNLPTISRTPLLLQFTPFAAPQLPNCEFLFTSHKEHIMDDGFCG